MWEFGDPSEISDPYGLEFLARRSQNQRSAEEAESRQKLARAGTQGGGGMSDISARHKYGPNPAKWQHKSKGTADTAALVQIMRANGAPSAGAAGASFAKGDQNVLPQDGLYGMETATPQGQDAPVTPELKPQVIDRVKEDPETKETGAANPVLAKSYRADPFPKPDYSEAEKLEAQAKDDLNAGWAKKWWSGEGSLRQRAAEKMMLADALRARADAKFYADNPSLRPEFTYRESGGQIIKTDRSGVPSYVPKPAPQHAPEAVAPTKEMIEEYGAQTGKVYAGGTKNPDGTFTPQFVKQKVEFTATPMDAPKMALRAQFQQQFPKVGPEDETPIMDEENARPATATFDKPYRQAPPEAKAFAPHQTEYVGRNGHKWVKTIDSKGNVLSDVDTGGGFHEAPDRERYVPVVTDQGVVPWNTRTGKTGAPAGPEGGEPYKKPTDPIRAISAFIQAKKTMVNPDTGEPLTDEEVLEAMQKAGGFAAGGTSGRQGGPPPGAKIGGKLVRDPKTGRLVPAS